jgi:hypothetical protein
MHGYEHLSHSNVLTVMFFSRALCQSFSCAPGDAAINADGKDDGIQGNQWFDRKKLLESFTHLKAASSLQVDLTADHGSPVLRLTGDMQLKGMSADMGSARGDSMCFTYVCEEQRLFPGEDGTFRFDVQTVVLKDLLTKVKKAKEKTVRIQVTNRTLRIGATNEAGGVVAGLTIPSLNPGIDQRHDLDFMMEDLVRVTDMCALGPTMQVTFSDQNESSVVMFHVPVAIAAPAPKKKAKGRGKAADEEEEEEEDQDAFQGDVSQVHTGGSSVTVFINRQQE